MKFISNIFLFFRISPSLAGIIANIIWGTTFLASHESLKNWGPFTSTTLRFSLAVVFLFLLLKILRFDLQIPRTQKQWFWLVLTALFGFGILYPLQIAALQWIPSGLSASLMLTAPLIVISLSALVGQHISSQKWIAVIVGTLGGISLIISHNPIIGKVDLANVYWKGIIMTLGASFCLAASTLTSREVLKEMNQYSVTLWSMSIGLLLLIPFSLQEPSRVFTYERGPLMALLYLAIIGSVVAFFLWNYALKNLPAQNLASSMHIKTPVAILLGILFAGERINHTFILGTILVAIGVWLSQRSNILPTLKFKSLVREK